MAPPVMITENVHPSRTDTLAKTVMSAFTMLTDTTAKIALLGLDVGGTHTLLEQFDLFSKDPLINLKDGTHTCSQCKCKCRRPMHRMGICDGSATSVHMCCVISRR